MVAYRVAESLNVLLRQINEAAPERSKASDGAIGDAAHASRTSDHNPWIEDPPGPNVVSARDITHDPGSGADMGVISRALVASRDKRIKYVIFNHRWARSYGRAATDGTWLPAWSWQPYSGPNPHEKHMHISVVSTKALYDSEVLWRLPQSEPKVYGTVSMVLQKVGPGSVGPMVALVQRALKLADDDGEFGPGTLAAVKAFQAAHNLTPVDGICGGDTYRALGLGVKV